MARKPAPERPVGGGGSRNPASLANLRPNPENLRRGVTKAPLGNARALVNGSRTVNPRNSPEWSPAVQLAILDLEARVGDELRDTATGEVYEWARLSTEVCGVQRVALSRAERWVADRHARGTYTLADDDVLTRIASRYHATLEREALTLRSRIDAKAASVSLAQAMSAVAESADVVEGTASDGV